MFAQVMFFGALLSAILSTSSGALLAPTALFTENVLKPLFGEMNDKRFLLTLRVVLVLFTAGVLVFALNNTSTMYEMVQNAYKVTLAGAFIPLVCGIYWNRATTQGALLSALVGMGAWIVAERFYAEAVMPPQFTGLIASAIAGSSMISCVSSAGCSSASLRGTWFFLNFTRRDCWMLRLTAIRKSHVLKRLRRSNRSALR